MVDIKEKVLDDCVDSEPPCYFLATLDLCHRRWCGPMRERRPRLEIDMRDGGQESDSRDEVRGQRWRLMQPGQRLTEASIGARAWQPSVSLNVSKRELNSRQTNYTTITQTSGTQMQA